MEIVYADPRIVVAVKPAGVLSTDEPGGMPQLLRQELGTPCIRTVHRLDAAVSGLMVYARSAKAASLLSEQLRSRTFGKEYLAVVHGVPKGGVMMDLLGRDPVRRRTYVAAEPGKNVRPAELSYEVLGSREGLSLVRIRLHTGRTHQIRVQFASRGFPLVGDRKYGGGEEGESIALWSWRLEFTHPQTGAAMRFSKLPPKETPWLGFPMPLTGRSTEKETAEGVRQSETVGKPSGFSDRRLAVCCVHNLCAYGTQIPHLQPEKYFLSRTCRERK